MAFRDLTQCARARSIVFARGKPSFFTFNQFRNLRLHRTESEFSIKPERAGFYAFFVLMPDLIRVNRDGSCFEQLAEKMQRTRVSPGRFAIAECVIEIETELHALKKRQAFGITYGHAILEDKRSVIGANGKPSLWRHAEKIDVRAAPCVSVENLLKVAVRKTVKLTITRG